MDSSRSAFPPGGFAPGMVYPSLPAPTFETIPEPDWEALPDVVKWAHTLATCSTMSFAEALSELTPLWDSDRERAYRSLETQLTELQTEAGEMEQLIGRQHAQIEELRFRKDKIREAHEQSVARERQQQADLEVLHGICEIMAAPFEGSLKSAHRKLSAISDQVQLLDAPPTLPGRDG